MALGVQPGGVFAHAKTGSALFGSVVTHRRERMRVMARRACLAALAAVLVTAVAAFKDNEMKKCSQLYFCRSNRGRLPEVYSAGDWSSSGNAVTSTLSHDATGYKFDMSLIAYDGGFVRFRVTEPGKRRFEVPDVLMDDLPKLEVGWTIKKLDAITTQLTSAAGATVVVTSRPFMIELVEGGRTVISLNERGLFNIEPLREKLDTDPDGAWQEVFNSHTDSKPKGPQSISLDLKFHSAHFTYGIPEHAASFALQTTTDKSPEGAFLGEPFRLYNLDVYEYLHDSVFGLYGSIPFLLGHGSGGEGGAPPRTVGAFWLNSAEMYVDITNAGSSVDAHWFAESGIVDLFLMPGPAAQDVWGQYAQITGQPIMPPLFSIAYHQCRWNYNDEADVTAVNNGFDEHDIPYDVLWLDIEHTDGKKYMTWDSSKFPTPVRMQEEIGAVNRRMVTIIDPHVKRDTGYEMHNEATRRGFYVKTASGDADFEGWCWPGSSSYLDVTNPAIREWWAEQFSFAKYKGSTSILNVWNDMNEPSVFNGPEVTMQKDLIHFNNWEHRDVHNAYGMYYHMATVQGLMQRSPEQRPFVLSRSFFAGSQRWGAIWTGDNAAEWEHLAVSVPMLLSMSVAGLPFVGADVGGFFKNPDGELMTRWYQLGAYYPFFRGHAHHETKRREPWLFGEPYTTAIRDAIRSRYAILPYMYTLFAESSRTGSPIVRPLWAEFPADFGGLAVQDEMMLGSALLVCPVVQAGLTVRTCYLPGTEADVWYNAATGSRHAGGAQVSVPVTLSDMPVFIRGGSVVPRRERARRSSAAMAGDPYTLVVALDAQGKAEGELYLDDGLSNDFRNKGAYRVVGYEFANGELRSYTVEGGAYETAALVERVVVLGLPKGAAPPRATVGGAAANGTEVGVSFGPLALGGRETAGPASVVVRRPMVPVQGDWTLTFQQ